MRAGADKRAIETRYAYDRENRVTQVVRDGVTVRTVDYDEAGNIDFERDANGNTTAYLYDARNLLIKESRPLAAVSTGERGQFFSL